MSPYLVFELFADKIKFSIEELYTEPFTQNLTVCWHHSVCQF